MNKEEYNLIGTPKKPTTPCCWNCKYGTRWLVKRSLKIPSHSVCDNKNSPFYGKEMKPLDGCKLLEKGVK